MVCFVLVAVDFTHICQASIAAIESLCLIEAEGHIYMRQ